MKLLLTTFLTLFSFVSFSQNCDYSSNINDSIGTYKSTKDVLMQERIFGNKTTLLFFSLDKTDNLKSLNFQLIEKSNDFISVNCLDKNSKIYFQLENGKIVTLIHSKTDACGVAVRDEKGNNNRITSTNFYFLDNAIAELKGSPISFMRVKYGIATKDYVIKQELISELDKKKYNPSNFFIDYLRCVE